MKERFKTPSAVFLLLMRNNNGIDEILMQKRKNTGYCDGYYDLCVGGHVESFESMKQTMCREAKEEIGITILPEDLEFVCLIHKNCGDVMYYNGYFRAVKWSGEPEIKEPNKNDELKWFPIDNLPSNLIDDRNVAIYNFFNGIKYTEYGWNGERIDH